MKLLKKLNLGCGVDYKEGWVNLDIGKEDVYGNKTKADIFWDLNKYPYPFKNNEFDFILMTGILEHLKDLNKSVKELAKISKPNAIIKIEVPYFTSYFAYRELYTHKFSLNCFQLFGIFKKNGIRLISKRLKNNNKFLKFMNFFINSNSFTQNFYERVFSGIFPVNQIVWTFKVKK